MKIAFLDFSTLNFGGGCEKNFMNLGRWLAKRGHDISFVTGSYKFNNQYCSLVNIAPHDKNISDDELSKVYKVNTYLTFNFIDLFWKTKNRKNIIKLLNGVDRIISKNEILEVLILRIFFHIDMHKVVFGFHTPTFYPTTRNYKERLHNLVYQSSFYRNFLKSSKVRYLFLNEEDRLLFDKTRTNSLTTVIPNPIDVNKFFQKNYTKGKFFDIYFIGRMAEQKGIDILAKAIESFQKMKMTNIRFFFIGNGDKEYLLKELQDKNENCFFIGFDDDVVKYYQAADLVVVPSRYESFCYVAAEAQSCGVPVIASNVSGPKDILIDGKTGWLIPSNNPEALLNSILEAERLWQNDYPKYLEIGTLARKNIIENFEENKINERVENFVTQS